MQTVKKKPQRKCLGCNEMKDKKELIRIVRGPEGEISLDFKGKKNGRGAYLCKNIACFTAARKRKSIERALQSAISPEIYQTLEEELMHENE